MIKSFTSRALKRYWEKGDPSKINPQHFAKVRRVLNTLEAATGPGSMNIPGFKFHTYKDGYSVWITGNWRITFEFDNGDAFNVNYEDYH